MSDCWGVDEELFLLSSVGVIGYHSVGLVVCCWSYCLNVMI